MEEKQSFKNSMARLEEIVSLLERNEIELEEAISLFEEGLKLVNSCDTQLKTFENKGFFKPVYIYFQAFSCLSGGCR